MAPMHDPIAQLKMAATMPQANPMAWANAYPAPKISNVGGMKMTVNERER